jgi:hypothetical protein
MMSCLLSLSLSISRVILELCVAALIKLSRFPLLSPSFLFFRIQQRARNISEASIARSVSYCNVSVMCCIHPNNLKLNILAQASSVPYIPGTVREEIPHNHYSNSPLYHLNQPSSWSLPTCSISQPCTASQANRPGQPARSPPWTFS